MIGPEFGLLDEAYALVDRSAALDPLTASTFNFRGACNNALGKTENAIKDLETAIRLEPEFIFALDGLARIFASVGRLNDAKKLHERSVKLKPLPNNHYKPDLAYAYAKLKNKEKALEIAPDNYLVLLALGMKEAAIKAMPFYSESDPSQFSAYLIFKYSINTKDYDLVRTDARFLEIMERNKKKYEENKKKYSVMDVIAKFSSTH
jgi:tetratricopeptide (TPR) repeat protein